MSDDVVCNYYPNTKKYEIEQDGINGWYEKDK